MLSSFPVDQYERYGRAKYWGSYVFGDPALTLHDPEMIKQVLVKDFDHFVNRNSPDQIGKMGGM